jgi:DNA-binding response OmpR family regulator
MEIKMTKILIVDDEQNMRTGLKDNLEFEGYEVDAAVDGEQGLKKISENNYNLIILDVMMPKMSGFDVCKNARKNGITPIILLTAKGEEIDKVVGLEIGADDYVTKPFSLRELLARVKAILRRRENLIMDNDSKEIIIGKLAIDFNGYKAKVKKKDVQMSHKEFEVLHYLWKRRNSTVSRDDLLSEIWGYDENPVTRTVDNFIMKLRQKVEVDPNHPQIILTVHGIGYKLILENVSS